MLKSGSASGVTQIRCKDGRLLPFRRRTRGHRSAAALLGLPRRRCRALTRAQSAASAKKRAASVEPSACQAGKSRSLSASSGPDRGGAAPCRAPTAGSSRARPPRGTGSPTPAARGGAPGCSAPSAPARRRPAARSTCPSATRTRGNCRGKRAEELVCGALRSELDGEPAALVALAAPHDSPPSAFARNCAPRQTPKVGSSRPTASRRSASTASIHGSLSYRCCGPPKTRSASKPSSGGSGFPEVRPDLLDVPAELPRDDAEGAGRGLVRAGRGRAPRSRRPPVAGIPCDVEEPAQHRARSSAPARGTRRRYPEGRGCGCCC